jgi:hypothetical protein
MQVIIHNIADPNKEAVIRSATIFYGKKLLPILNKKVTVNVYWEYDLGKDLEAETEWVDSNILPKVFNIKLSKHIKNFRKIIQTIAHEMVHVKQFAKGEIYDHKYRRTFKWGNQTFNIDTCDYWESPWEIEAFGREVGLFYKFKDFFDLTNKNLEKEFAIAYKKVTERYEHLLHYNPHSNRVKKKRKGNTNAVVCGNDAETSAGGRAPAS